jgi:hypothetical protein
MRYYPHDSPQAAARLLALTLVSDGQLQTAELQALARSRAPERLGLTEAEFHAVVHGLCDDLLADRSHIEGDACVLDPATIAWLFEQVSHPALRRKVLRLAMQCIHADGRLHEGEMRVLLAAVDHWSMRPEGLEHLLMPPPPPPRRPVSLGLR